MRTLCYPRRQRNQTRVAASGLAFICSVAVACSPGAVGAPHANGADLGTSRPEGCGDGVVDATQLCYRSQRLTWEDVGIRQIGANNTTTVDLDEDGREELLILAKPTDDDYPEMSLIAYQDGSFVRRWRTEPGVGAFGFATDRDFDGDGDPDVLFQGDLASAGVHFNHNGVLGPITWYADDTTFNGWTPRGIAIPFDGDNDGGLDGVATTIWFPADNFGGWLFTEGGTGFQATQGPIELSGCQAFGQSVYGDFNGDGRTDFIARDLGSVCDPHPAEYDPEWWRFYVFLEGSGSDPVEFAGSFPVGGVFESGIHAADYDRDGALDLVLALPNGISFVRGRGDGSFDPPLLRRADDDGVYSLEEIADFDGDGEQQMLVRRDYGLVVTPLSPSDRSERMVDVEIDEAGDVDIADLNGDGIADLLVEDPTSESPLKDRIVLLSTH